MHGLGERKLAQTKVQYRTENVQCPEYRYVLYGALVPAIYTVQYIIYTCIPVQTGGVLAEWPNYSEMKLITHAYE